MLRNPAPSDHDDAAALLQHKLSKITMVAQAQPARFIGPAKQTTRPCQSLRAIEFVLDEDRSGGQELFRILEGAFTQTLDLSRKQKISMRLAARGLGVRRAGYCNHWARAGKLLSGGVRCPETSPITTGLATTIRWPIFHP
ncbi:MAG: hypothetical protein DME18_16480 [Verrucomicrobia bacterium]|nr:MAG: hypothetical protein DME18_16480 [Verrucomicrobiota bacterium]